MLTRKMTDENGKEPSIELLPCSFKFHEFGAQVGEVKIKCHIIKMEDCLYLWIGDFNDCKMNDLSFAIKSTYEQLPITTRIMGSVLDTASANIGSRLTKKIGKPVYVSFNTLADNISLPAIEKKIQEEIFANKDLLSF